MIPHKIRTSIKFVMNIPRDFWSTEVLELCRRQFINVQQRHIINFEPTQLNRCRSQLN